MPCPAPTWGTRPCGLDCGHATAQRRGAARRRRRRQQRKHALLQCAARREGWRMEGKDKGAGTGSMRSRLAARGPRMRLPFAANSAQPCQLLLPVEPRRRRRVFIHRPCRGSQAAQQRRRPAAEF
eukprot:365942-Chlamydomonas_euryale.AAC.83